MLIRIILTLILFLNSANSSQSFAKKTPEQIEAEKIAKAEKKEQKVLEKQRKKEEKEKQKLEKIRLKKEKKEKEKADLEAKLLENKKLLEVTPDQTVRFRKIVKKLTSYMGRDPKEYTLRIKESSSLNATARLGKKLTVYSATFHKIKTEAGLATIIAHEMGHIERKHVAKGVATGVAAGAAGLTLSLLTGSADAGRLFNGVAGTARKAHSRSQERSADLFAIDLMNKTYCKVPGKLEAYKLFIEQDKDIHYAEYRRSHPISQDRYDYMAKMIKDAGCVV